MEMTFRCWLLAHWDHLPPLGLHVGAHRWDWLLLTGFPGIVLVEIRVSLNTACRAAHGEKGPNPCSVGALTCRGVLARPDMSRCCPGVHMNQLTLTMRNCME